MYLQGIELGILHTEGFAVTDFANPCFFIKLWVDDSSKTSFGF